LGGLLAALCALGTIPINHARIPPTPPGRQCAEYNVCSRYQPAKAAGKPMFNIEYDAAAFARACTSQDTFGMTTILKVRLGDDTLHAPWTARTTALL
jgi:hypothetical protein